MSGSTLRAGFTLIELLLVVAIVAVVGAGVAVTYGHDMLARARRQVTLREMGNLRDAFGRFHDDNLPRLLRGLPTPEGATLPETFRSGPYAVDTVSGTVEGDNRLYGMLESYERFGLWPLLQPTATDAAGNRLEADRFIVFDDFDPVTGEGWQGPYVTTVSAEARTEDFHGASRDLLLPQPRTRYGGLYRVVYYEHCNDAGDPAEPVYRRLFLVCAEQPEKWEAFAIENSGDTRTGLGLLTGNRRMGETASGNAWYGYPLDLTTGTLKTAYDAAHGLFIVELLNLDDWRR